MMKQVRLRKGKEESLKRFHPWVFSGAIASIDEGITEGEVVRVVTNSGDFIAVGHYQEGSIAVRVLTFSDVQIDDEFWHSRLASALKMRQAIGIADNPNNKRAVAMLKVLAAQGMTLSEMTDTLNNEGFVTSQGHEFRVSQVYVLLKRYNIEY
jgi:hypothetical protein